MYKVITIWILNMNSDNTHFLCVQCDLCSLLNKSTLETWYLITVCKMYKINNIAWSTSIKHMQYKYLLFVIIWSAMFVLWAGSIYYYHRFPIVEIFKTMDCTGLKQHMTKTKSNFILSLIIFLCLHISSTGFKAKFKIQAQSGMQYDTVTEIKMTELSEISKPTLPERGNSSIAIQTSAIFHPCSTWAIDWFNPGCCSKRILWGKIWQPTAAWWSHFMLQPAYDWPIKPISIYGHKWLYPDLRDQAPTNFEKLTFYTDVSWRAHQPWSP